MTGPIREKDLAGRLSNLHWILLGRFPVGKQRIAGYHMSRIMMLPERYTVRLGSLKQAKGMVRN